MTVEELKGLIDAGKQPVVLDVREPFELQTAPYPFPVIHIPMNQLPKRYSELPQDQTIVCACRSGGRSAQAVYFLMQKGYPQAVNLEGGILAWAARFEPRVSRY